jgi:glycosyltransferase involved in cell wall biosynthesis
MINISYDYQIFTSQSYGGISRYFYELCSRIKTQSEEAICSNIFVPLHVNQYIHQLDAHQLKTFFEIKPFRGSSRVLGLLNESVSRLRNGIFVPDLVHETYYAKRTVAPKKCPIVITVYDMVHELFSKNFNANNSANKLKRLAIERADHVICISESTKQDLMRLFGTAEEKISVTHLGFSINNGKTNDEPYLAKPHEKPFILHVGGRAAYKNFTGLLQAYASSAQLRNNFDLVAFGANSVQADEMVLIQKLGLLDHVRFVGGNDQKLAQYYQAATLFVYPSLYEGFGIPPLEAMYFGCPVACSNTSSVPEVVGSAAKLFDPSNQESMRLAMEELVTDKAVRDRYIKLGYERLKMFSWNKCANETANIYKKLLG